MFDQAITTTHFRDLCDDTSDAIALNIGDLPRLYEIVGVPTAQSLQISELSKYVATQIRSCLPNDVRPLRWWADKLHDRLIAQHVVNDLPLQPYLSIALALKTSPIATPAAPPHSEVMDWPKVLQLCRFQAELCPSVYLQSDLATHCPRAFAVARACRRMRDRGFKCSVDDGASPFEPHALERMVAGMEQVIALLGGRRVAESLLKMLSARYRPDMQRYAWGRHVDGMGLRMRPRVPLAYLLQLSAKQLGKAPFANRTDERVWTGLLKFATDFVATYDVQPYVLWELEFKNRCSLMDFAQELALYDRFFGFRQFRAADLDDAIQSMFEWVTQEEEKLLGWRVASASRVAQAIFTELSNRQGLSSFDVGAVVRRCRTLPADEVRLITALLTHQDVPNREFTLPALGRQPNFFSKPLVRCEDGTLVLLDRALCAPACLDAVAAAICKVNKQAFSKIGLAVETFLLRRMQAHKITVLRGRYQHHEGNGECDAVVETEDCIIFCELKIKSLTGAAQGASDLHIFSDLSATLFDSASQCNRHELVLRKRGSITLKQEDGTERTLHHRGRSVEKMALTFDDYGSFQDRTVISQVFAVAVGSKFEAADPALQSKLDNLNQKSGILNEQFRELAKLNPSSAEKPFFAFWFLSVPQLLILLDYVDSNESFKTQLWLARHLTTHSLDFCTDLAFARGLEQHRGVERRPGRADTKPQSKGELPSSRATPRSLRPRD